MGVTETGGGKARSNPHLFFPGFQTAEAAAAVRDPGAQPEGTYPARALQTGFGKTHTHQASDPEHQPGVAEARPVAHSTEPQGTLATSPAPWLPLHQACSTFRLKRARQSIPVYRFLLLLQPQRKDCLLGSPFSAEGRRARVRQHRPQLVSRGKGTGHELGLLQPSLLHTTTTLN